MTFELWPVWWAPSRGSRSTTATERPRARHRVRGGQPDDAAADHDDVVAAG